MSRNAEAGPVACAGAIVWRGDEVLLIKRGKAPRLGEWSIPGGRIEGGETARAAAIREVFEETGCTIEIIALCDVVDSTADGFHAVLVDFTARWVSGEPVAGDDAAEARFVPYRELAAMGLWSETLRVIALSRTQVLGRKTNGRAQKLRPGASNVRAEYTGEKTVWPAPLFPHNWAAPK